MITAETARTNVINYKEAQDREMKEITNEILDRMSKTIELHSKNGYESAEFMPFRDSRFSNDYMQETASKIFAETFKENGYRILFNDWKNNRLVISWY